MSSGALGDKRRGGAYALRTGPQRRARPAVGGADGRGVRCRGTARISAGRLRACPGAGANEARARPSAAGRRGEAQAQGGHGVGVGRTRVAWALAVTDDGYGYGRDTRSDDGSRPGREGNMGGAHIGAAVRVGGLGVAADRPN